MDPIYGIITDENWIAALPAEVNQAVVARMTRLAVPAGGEVRRAGTPANRIIQIESGFLRLTGLHEDGSQSLITIYARGNCFGETAVVSRRDHNHSTYAITPTVVRQLMSHDFWELYHRYPAIPEALCRKFAMSISRQIAARELRATQRLGKRIALMFENLVEHCGEPLAQGAWRIALPITQSDIADLFDVTRQSVQREITALKVAAIVEKRSGSWIVADAARLRQLA